MPHPQRLPGDGDTPALELPHDRCPGCRLLHHHCMCEAIPALTCRHGLQLIVHNTEYPRLSNTGLLGWRALDQAWLYVHGHRERRGSTLVLPEGFEPLLLHPPAERSDLTEPDETESGPPRPLESVDRGAGPYVLLVPDGTWPQTRRMVRRIPALSRAPRVTLPEGLQSGYGQLRKAQRPGQLSTLEAIAHALGILEGEGLRDELLALFSRFIAGTLACKREQGRHIRPAAIG